MDTRIYIIHSYLRYIRSFLTDDDSGLDSMISDLEKNSDQYIDSFRDLVSYCNITYQEVKLKSGLVPCSPEDLFRKLLIEIRNNKIDSILKDV